MVGGERFFYFSIKEWGGRLDSVFIFLFVKIFFFVGGGGVVFFLYRIENLVFF